MCKQGPFSQLVEGRRCPNRFLGFGGDCPIGGCLDWKRQLVPRVSSLYRKIEQREIVLPKRAQRGLRHACRSHGSARWRPSGGSWLRQHVQSEHVEMMISEKQRHSIHQKPPYRAKSMLTVAEAAKVAQRHRCR